MRIEWGPLNPRQYYYRHRSTVQANYRVCLNRARMWISSKANKQVISTCHF